MRPLLTVSSYLTYMFDINDYCHLGHVSRLGSTTEDPPRELNSQGHYISPQRQTSQKNDTQA